MLSTRILRILVAGLSWAQFFVPTTAWAASAGAPVGPLQPKAPAATLTVTNTNDSGVGSFRWAIEQANSTPAADTIEFGISGFGDKVIALTSALPPITQPVTIDGRNNGACSVGTNPNVMVSGELLSFAQRGDGAHIPNPASSSGGDLWAGSDGSEIGCLAFVGFDVGIRVQADSVTLVNNWLGVSITGTSSSTHANRVGILIESANNVIGLGTSTGNLVSNNVENGVEIRGASATSNTLRGNLIGTTSNGNAALPNGTNGVYVENANGVTLGGTTGNSKNVVSGNGKAGIVVTGTASNVTMLANNVGLNDSGTLTVPNVSDGVYVAGSASGVKVGGTTAGGRINIASNGGHGLVFDASLGDFALALANARVPNPASSSGGDGLVIDGNGGHGVFVNCSDQLAPDAVYVGNASAPSAEIRNSGLDDVHVRGCGGGDPGYRTMQIVNARVGSMSGATGSGARAGIVLSDAPHVQIGDSGASALVVVGDHTGPGVHISGTNAATVTLVNSYIGTDPTGTLARPNVVGVLMERSASHLSLGMPALDAVVIAGNGKEGVVFEAGIGKGNQIQNARIGTTANGLSALGNAQCGISVNGADDLALNSLLIGGTNAGEGNIIGGNGGSGVCIQDKVNEEMLVLPPTRVQVMGNRIGLGEISGTLAVNIPNGKHGVELFAAGGVIIGGTASTMTNYIGNNVLDGVFITGTGTMYNYTWGNKIGVNVDDATPAGNGRFGASIDAFASRNKFGGLSAGEPNLIVDSGATGVRYFNSYSQQNANVNAIRHTSPTTTNLLIDMGPTGVTLNDAPDVDGVLNFPVISKTVSHSQAFVMNGSLTSLPNTSFTLATIFGATCHPAGYGLAGFNVQQLQTFTVTTDANGLAIFNVALPPTAGAGFVSLVSIDDAYKQSSEYSACTPVTVVNTPRIVFLPSTMRATTSAW